MTGAAIACVIRADARALPLAHASVDLVVTSPPYFALRSYQDSGEHYTGQLGSEATPAEYLDALIACTREMMRVLKPCGSIWLNLGDKYVNPSIPGDRATLPAGGRPGTAPSESHRSAKQTLRMVAPSGGMRAKSLMGIPWRYALRCIDELGLILRAEVIWSKPNGLPESVTDRVRRSHETWFHFTKQPRYFSAVDEIREPASEYARSRDYERGKRDGTTKARTLTDSCNPLGKLPGSVWTIPTQPLTVPEHLGADHFAAFPIEWPGRIILGWSPPGGTVLDPFGGTGTTALAAKALGRHGISVDMSADYCRLARWRTNDPGEIAKALRVERPPAEVAGQTDMLELIGAAP